MKMKTIRELKESCNPCRDIVEGKTKVPTVVTEPWVPFVAPPASAPKPVGSVIPDSARPLPERCRRVDWPKLWEEFKATQPGEFTSEDFFLHAKKMNWLAVDRTNFTANCFRMQKNGHLIPVGKRASGKGGPPMRVFRFVL